MKRRTLLAGLMMVWLTPLHAAERIPVVASFSILADIASNVGAGRVSVTSLVGPDGDSHVYTPSPADAKAVSTAQLVIVNGLGFEGWLPRLIGAASRDGLKAMTAVASEGITPRREDGSLDPHAWQSVANAKVYATNIRDALIAADPDGTAAYRANTDAYLAKLDALDREVREAVAKIPPERRKVISTHDAFGYFAAAYGIDFIAPQGVSTESEASARDVARIITQIRAQKVPAVFLENVSDPRLIRRIAAETGAKVGGTLFTDALTGEKGEAPTYIDMVRHNIKALTQALAD